MTVATWPQQWERSLARLDFKPRCLWPYYFKKKKKKDRKERKRIKIQITLFRNLREGNAASMQMQESTT